MGQRYAAWLYNSDPAVKQVFQVPPSAPPNSEDLGLHVVHLVVVRDDIGEPRAIMRTDSASQTTYPPNLWELPLSALSAVQSGALTPPSGFELNRWQSVEAPDTRVPTIQVHRLTLTNIRCFDSIEFALQPGFTLLIGDNGAGKTTVLDALADTFAQIVQQLTGQSEDRLTLDDVRMSAVSQGQTATNEPRYPARVDVNLSVWGEQLNEYGWQVTQELGATFVGTGKPISFLNTLDFMRWSVATDHRTPLPVLAYYRTSRTSPSSSPDIPQRSARNSPSRLSGYRDWDRSNADLGRFEQWFERKELEQYQRGITLGVLEAVKRAIQRCLHSQKLYDFGFNAVLGSLAARSHSGPWIPFTRLSAGVRNMFGLVTDLAIRCAMLNPHLGYKAAAKTSGIVLIDELDLHLHPTWQRHVITDLRAAFPHIQFIVTTHSGLLVSNLHPEEIVSLELDAQTAKIVPRTGKRPDPRLLTSSELYREYFGIDSYFAQELGQKLDDYRYWARNPYRDDKRDQLVKQLARELREAGIEPSVAPVPRRDSDAHEEP